MTVFDQAAMPAILRLSLLTGTLLAATQAVAATPAKLAVPASAAASAPGGVELAPQIDLAEGKSTLLHLPFPAARLAVGDAQVADVILINPSEVYMLGKSSGSTNLIIWNKANHATIIDISVGLDTVGLRKQLDQLFPEEKDIRLTVSGGTVILSGVVSDTVQASQILAVVTAYAQRSTHGSQGAAAAPAAVAAPAAPAPLDASAAPAAGGSVKVINMMSVGAPQQVMLEVKIAEISKSLVDKLGADVGASISRGNWTYSLLSNLLSGSPSVVDGFNGKNGNFATIDAQKADGLIKILAEPTLMAISGQEASFLAGGKIFIPVAQGSGGTATITLEEKEYGVAVKFTPTVLNGGRINLKVAPEVSSLDRDGIGISATGATATTVLPSFTTRRASTTVQLKDGQSFAIGGLLQNNVTTNIKAFPMLGEIPVLGALFRSSEFQKDKTELVFIVTPHLARPLSPDYKLPTDAYVEPGRAEFFLGGKLEGKPAGAQQAVPAADSTVTPVAAPVGNPDVK